jgi:hypothetical protein
MVSLVEQMLARSVHKRLAAASASDRELYQRQTVRPAVLGVDATDREIDKLVYELPKGAGGGGDQGGGGEVRDQTGKICLTLVLTEYKITAHLPSKPGNASDKATRLIDTYRHPLYTLDSGIE